MTSLLLETDAPDQPDQSHANKRNEPAYVVHTLKEIALLRDQSWQTIAESTTKNTINLFNLQMSSLTKNL